MLVLWGLTEMEAIVAATKNSAAAAGLLDEVGTIELGKIADMIVVAKDPLIHISHLRTLTMLVRDGNIIDTGAPESRPSYFELFYLE
jgi:imidazolonepropionase-like amidohydrolase